jgi:GNAT superfamily N-acetyltransferase
MDLARAIALLERDPLRYVVTLKMLAHFRAQMELRLLEDDRGWALLALLPTSAFEYDARHYADVPHAVLVNGSSDDALLALLAELPQTGFVLKTGDAIVQRFARTQFGLAPVRSFASFTVSSCSADGAEPVGELDAVDSGSLDAQALELFTQTIYDEAELQKYFAQGAHWFGLREGGRLVSGCFVFENFGTVWEVAGVFTRVSHRRRGLGAQVVRAALVDLLARGRQPRYQVETSNFASLELARRIGSSEFIRIEHFVVRR